MNTKEKILDAAERLIGDQGYASTSLRQIIAEAGVNLAAIHYHFGSKEELLDEIIRRKAGPVNEQRLALLDEAEREAGRKAPPVERVLDAFLRPVFEAKERNPQIVRVMGRMYSEGLMPLILVKHFQPVVVRFHEAMRRSLPHLTEDELRWRLELMFGAMATVMWHRPSGMAPVMSGPEVLPRLLSFFGAAFRSPVTPKEVCK